jgi:hypothetical protein
MKVERRGRRLVGLELRHAGHGHELCAVLMIEPPGYFELFGFFARRDRCPDHVLGKMIFVSRGVDQVDPNRVLCKRRLRVRGHLELRRDEAIVLMPIDSQHASPSPVGLLGWPSNPAQGMIDRARRERPKPLARVKSGS